MVIPIKKKHEKDMRCIEKTWDEEFFESTVSPFFMFAILQCIHMATSEPAPGEKSATMAEGASVKNTGPQHWFFQKMGLGVFNV